MDGEERKTDDSLTPSRQRAARAAAAGGVLPRRRAARARDAQRRARGRHGARGPRGHSLQARPVARVQRQRRDAHRAPPSQGRRRGERLVERALLRGHHDLPRAHGHGLAAADVLRRRRHPRGRRSPRAARVPRPVSPPRAVALLPRASEVLVSHRLHLRLARPVVSSVALPRGLRRLRRPAPHGLPIPQLLRLAPLLARRARTADGPRRGALRRAREDAQRRHRLRRSVRGALGVHRGAAAPSARRGEHHARRGRHRGAQGLRPRRQIQGGSGPPAPQGFRRAPARQGGVGAPARGGDPLRARPAGVRRGAHPRARRGPLDAPRGLSTKTPRASASTRGSRSAPTARCT